MSREWEEVNISETIMSSNTGLDAIKRAPIVDYDSGIKCLRIQDISQEKSFDEWGFCKIEDRNYSKFQLKKGDIIVARTGATIGVNKIIKKDLKAVYNNGLIRIKVNKNIIDSNYLYYNMQGYNYKGHIQAICAGTSTQPNMKMNDLLRFTINLPPLNEQKAIAHILSTLDEKIEVNNQINKKLEEMAQTIFKHWFVDFEFPNENGEPYKSSGGEMVESELGMIPKGWEVDSIGDLVKEIVTGKTPSTKDPENYGNKYPFITIPDMHNNVFITKTERYLSEKGNKVQINKLLPENSIIVSCIATVGLVAINEKPAHTNQQINSIIPNRDEDVYYFYEYLKLMSDKLKAIGSTGSTTLNVNKGEFEKIKYIYPQKQVMIAFNNLIKSNFEMIKKKQLENERLSNLRDTLLPKLMSGELRVPLEEDDIS